MQILGVGVDDVGRQEAVGRISGWLRARKGLKHVVTIYSEFLLAARKDKDFRRAVEKADLVVPDGVGVLAAMEYQRKGKGLLNGLKVGLAGLKGELREPVTGVWLFEELVGLAASQGWKVFLLGGFGDTAERLARKLQIANNRLQIEWDAGERKVGESRKENDRVIEKINRFRPDLLFVAYGPIKQEKWIHENKGRLKVKVAMGVGGTFDEALGDFPKAPRWMESRGLKALWRLMIQPKRLPRVFRGMVLFPWMVYRESI